MADFTLTTGRRHRYRNCRRRHRVRDGRHGGDAQCGDSLTGGAGTDMLALYGGGNFRVDQLATFTGFESITLNNFTSE